MPQLLLDILLFGIFPIGPFAIAIGCALPLIYPHDKRILTLANICFWYSLLSIIILAIYLI